ncbi:MAG: sodium:solute symporter family protein [Calditrichaeota bacterium]|nr:sodium:solute symporter family protein [Calditrichota bacterium]MCB0294014.1 sodium:solute symporter family protein [Calditrichota bacterium]MCB0303771.1 sodium:solute symporter family protein [Calditrichota bacterium]MCB9090337.1 sodium:solute symporter family protein [Calditrichia bacterium]
MVTLSIIILYLLVTLAIGYYGYRIGQNHPDDYFLAGRDVGPVVLFFTLIATNFSAFFFLGFAGAGYRIGYSYYGIMSFGTALVALTFYFIGHKAWLLGKAKGYITPPEMIGDRFRSRPLKVLFLIVMVIFTVPYLALQPIGAGILLQELTNGLIPYFQGAVILTVVIVLYVFLGGMRSVALTDVVQGVIMFSLMFLAVWVVADALGGLSAANARVYALNPELFSREGAGGYFTPRKWFSFMILWMLAVPMFPQMFMRFFISRDVAALRTSARLYPLVTALLFLCPVIIGVIGHIPFPELAGKEADKILPLMLTRFTPEWLGALIMVGALAAFMSTMDSQLLALSSMLTRDLYRDLFKTRVTYETQVQVGKILIVILSLLGLLIAYRPPATIFQIATQAFTGLAILFPTTIAALYWPRATAGSCIASILVGEGLLIGLHYELIPASFTLGFLPVVPLVGIAALMIVVGSLVSGKKPAEEM